MTAPSRVATSHSVGRSAVCDSLCEFAHCRQFYLERDAGAGYVGCIDLDAGDRIGGGCGSDVQGRMRRHAQIIDAASTIVAPMNAPGEPAAHPEWLGASLAATVEAARQERGWSINALAQASGVSRAMIAKIERGDVQPTAALLARLSGAFGMTLSELVASAEGVPDRLSRREHQPVWRDPERDISGEPCPQGRA